MWLASTQSMEAIWEEVAIIWLRGVNEMTCTKRLVHHHSVQDLIGMVDKRLLDLLVFLFHAIEEERDRNLPKVTGFSPFLDEDFQMRPKRKKAIIFPSGSSWVLGTVRALGFGLSYQGRVARNRQSDTELRHK